MKNIWFSITLGKFTAQDFYINPLELEENPFEAHKHPLKENTLNNHKNLVSGGHSNMVVINKKYKVVRMNGIPVEVTVMGLDYSYPNKTLGRLTDTTGT